MKNKHWICDCPEWWIYPMTTKVCVNCFLMSPREIISKTREYRGRKFWARMTKEERIEFIKKQGMLRYKKDKK